jgi:hypothetical protein
MVDLSAIDLVALIEQHTPIRFGKAVGRNEKRARKGGPCPFCGLGNDRFAVFINTVPQRYYCGIHGNGCKAQGDAITFVREYLQVDSHYEACEFLEVDPGSEYAGPRRRNVHTDEEPPCPKWREQAERFCRECKDRLWSEEGKPALDWLRARGLTDSIIERAGLGLNLAQGYQSAKEWGTDKKVWVSRGIVIPWSVGGAIWKVNIRRSDKDIAAENHRLHAQGKKENAPKYKQISGSTNGLYGVDTIQPGQPLVMVEGEFDLLAFLQATEGRIAVVATGSTANGRGERWREAVKQATPVLVAFDDDENKAGEHAASVWKEYVPHSIRWVPWGHDLNEMLLQGMDIPNWVDLGIGIHQAMQTPVTPKEEELPMCADCGTQITAEDREFFYVPTSEDEATCYCSQCRDELGQPVQSEIPQQPVTQPDQEQPAETPILTDEQQFMNVVQQIADIFGGCTITVDPPGYTIADRARELAAARVTQPSDHWAEVKARAARPPVNARNRPFYTPEAWRKKYAELQSWRPDEKLYAHYPGGYEGYCRMYQQKTEAPIVIESTLVERATQPATAEKRDIPELLTIEAICEQHGFQIGQPCEKCGCPLQYELSPYTYCVRCYPPPRRGYDTYSDLIDRRWPRRMKTSVAARRQRAASA